MAVVVVTNRLFTSTAARFLRIRTGTESDETPFPLDADGFLDSLAPTTRHSDALAPGALVPPAIAAQSRALVLLGEPGIGKSTVFDSLVETAQGAFGRVARVDGANITDETFHDEIGHLIADLPDVAQVASAVSGRSQQQTLIIDQLDESPIIRRLPRILRASLAAKDVSGLRIFLACRTADYPPALTEVLAGALGNCVVADLAPLTRGQAENLVRAPGTDGEAFIEAVIAAGAAALASVPLTLGLLMRVHQRTGRLEGGPRGLFEECVVGLLDASGGDPESDETTIHQRLAVASRLAAYLLLCGRRTLWHGRVLDAGPQDLEASILADGTEDTPSGTFQVTAAVVRSTLRTALFTGRGHNRLAFRHSSIAAYLAARYIVHRHLPARQLEDLFLVAGGRGARSIPEVLRETAAWLLNLSPANADWLVDADARSLAGHSRLVDSETVRELLVAALLKRADEVELTEAPWTRAGWQLAHPRLAQQIDDVLIAAGDIEPSDWPAVARIRLAVRLAREARSKRLVDPLLRLAENGNWSSHIRELAAVTAFDMCPDDAAPRLIRILRQLGDPETAARTDSEDELKGTLLDLLWPEWLDASDVLPYLTPQRRDNLFGSYRLFKTRFPESLSREDLLVVLDWCIALIGRHSVEEGPRADPKSDATAVEDLLPEEQPISGVDVDLIEALMNRGAEMAVLSDDICDRLARLAWPRLRRFDSPPIPAPFSVVGPEGVESAAATAARRRFTKALLGLVASRGEFHRGLAWQIVDNWRRTETWHSPGPGLSSGPRARLLDSGDFSWAFNEAETERINGNDALAQALGVVAASLFDPDNSEAMAVVYHAKSNPTWQELRWWFDAVEIDSDRAEQMKRAAGYYRPPPKEWPEADAFRKRLNHLLDQVREGNTDAFWQLLWNLQFHPSSGRGRHQFHDDPTELPGMVVLPADAADVLARGALNYILKERDHAEEWLPTPSYDKRGWAGYLALALLDKLDQIASIPVEAWRRWTGVIVWFHAAPVNAGDRHRKERLLSLAARQAPTDLSRSLELYVRAELARGHSASEAALISPGCDPALAASWRLLMNELLEAVRGHQGAEPVGALGGTDDVDPRDRDDAIDMDPGRIVLPQTGEALQSAMYLWEVMFRRMVEADRPAGLKLAKELTETRPSTDSERHLSVETAAMSLGMMTAEYWPVLSPQVAASPAFARSVGLAVGRRHGSLELTPLDEEDLEAIYRWLAGAFPPEEDVDYPGAHFVSPEEQARELRDDVLRNLAERGTHDAVDALLRLQESFPNRVSVTSRLLSARTNLFAIAWNPPTPAELTQLFRDSDRRFVRSADELADLVVETLGHLSRDIPARGELLWDRIPRRTTGQDEHSEDLWRPKPEAALSAYVAHDLSLRLTGRGLAVNREVLILPRNAYGSGDRTDILIEAAVIEHSLFAGSGTKVSLVVEVKGAWNPDVISDLRDQLASRYLSEAGTQVGVYVVGWYPREQWNDSSDSRRTRQRESSQELAVTLQREADDVSHELRVRVIPLVLQIPRPHRREAQIREEEKR